MALDQRGGQIRIESVMIFPLSEWTVLIITQYNWGNAGGIGISDDGLTKNCLLVGNLRVGKV